MPSTVPTSAIAATFHSAWCRCRTATVTVIASAASVVATTAVWGSTVSASNGVATRANPKPVTAWTTAASRMIAPATISIDIAQSLTQVEGMRDSGGEPAHSTVDARGATRRHGWSANGIDGRIQSRQWILWR